MRPLNDGSGSSGYLVTALGAVVALLCLVLGVRLLCQEAPQELRAWLAEPLVRSGLALSLGGAFLVFLLAATLLLAIRRRLDSPRRKIGRGAAPTDPSGLEDEALALDSPAVLAERELARWLAAQDRPPASRLELDEAARQLRETVGEAERILAEIEQASCGASAPRPPASGSRDE